MQLQLRSAGSFATSLLVVAVAADGVRAQCVPAAVQKLLASNGAANDLFGRSVAVEGANAAAGSSSGDGVVANSGCAYKFTSSGAVWSQSAVLSASDGAAGDQFGFAVAVSGSRTVAGAYGDADQGASTGAAYVFFGLTQEAKLVASDATAGDTFGYAVAISGHRVVVGAPGDDDLGSSSGSAYVFEWTGSQWLQGAKLLAAAGVANDRFGTSVAIDGDLVIVGARSTDQGASNAGSAYVFEWDSSAWVQRAQLVAADAGANDEAGRAVDIDQQRALVGAPFDALGASDDGSAYVFTRSGNSWTQSAKLVASDVAENRNFGWSVSLSGTRALVGAHLDNAGGTTAGAAYLFELTGGAWTQRVKLTASDAAANDNFGAAVALGGSAAWVGSIADDDLGSSSGSVYAFDAPLTWTRRHAEYGNLGAHGNAVALGTDRAVVGEPADATQGAYTGAVHVLDFAGGSWSDTELHASDANAGACFGAAVALDQDRIAVAADRAAGNPGEPAVYVFLRSGGAWIEEAKLVGGSPSGGFGSAVALSGEWLAVGHSSQSLTGTVYMYRRAAGTWGTPTLLTPVGGDPIPSTSGKFGESLALVGNRLVVGCSGDHDDISGGAVYVFEWNGVWTQTARITEPSSTPFAAFGKAVALSRDAILIGAPDRSFFQLNSGVAYLYELAGASWVYTQTFGGAAVAGAGDYFGASVALWGDRAVIGAPRDTLAFPNFNPGSGTAWAYEQLQPGYWAPVEELRGPINSTGTPDSTGLAVAVLGDRILCGSPWAEDPSMGGSFWGAAFFFERDCPREWIASYCTAAITSNGCKAHIAGIGDPSATNASSFTLNVTNVEGQKQGHVFYGMNGTVAAPWGPGGFLCVKAPTQRTPPQSSGGTAGACNGVITLSLASLAPGSLGTPFSSGDTLWAQCWFRDPPSPKTTNLSDALQLTFLP